jgi:signal transduction histidine kinase
MALRDAALNIRKGDLSKKIELESTDEFGELSNQLDDMRGSIKSRTEEILKKDVELNEVNKSLIETEKSKDEFISMVSHELKTPLMPIKLYSDMLLKKDLMGTLNAKQNKAIETIRKSVERLEVLISDMLDVQKLEIGRFKLHKTSVNVRELIDQTISALIPLAETKNVRLLSQVNVSNETIFCDPRRFEQVLSNLVKNGIEFAPQKEGKIIVRVEEGTKQNMDAMTNDSANEALNSYLVFSVEDNGVGVPAEKSDDLFKKFYQIDTSATRKHGGTGLGLAICKGIIEAHGGKIWLDLKYMKGARFKFTLPKDSYRE